jgi:serine phosphatase RsbU (regulator of sigma subunit)
MKRVLDTVRAARHLPPAAIVTSLLNAARDFTQGEPDDDMTAIVVKVTEGT